ncbi:MAG TPA: hypothetical protein VGH40_15380 [Roseiarcus sp.]|jgi:hypothetical protein
MGGSFHKRGKYAWVRDAHATFVCIRNGDLVAAVFSTACEPWSEGFDDPQAAMARAEEILDGAVEVCLEGLPPSRVVQGHAQGLVR